MSAVVAGGGGRIVRVRREALGGAVLLLAGTLAAPVLRSPVPVVLGLVAALVVRGALRRRAARVAAERAAREVAEVCAALAAELRAGCLAAVALERALAEEPDADADGGLDRPALLGAARYGGDVPAALRRAGAAPGAEGLAGLAACWELASGRGAGLAAGVERLAASLRAAEALREEVRAQLAAPRSTALLLAVLPLIGVVLGTAMGANPVRILLHTAPGLGCLAVGLLLEAAGLAWTAALAGRAESRARTEDA
ncbi:hypothetical protein BIV57_20285 [Mangrovactinospora gilvigrisea]|uniref:Type II secretion system protein GspF domain-containing protein n=1 Tax=Mangrovactinospora gilvigrisea TaxID=1428644 RepID=A0A1J7BAF1_9ACTN|nr:type II secretion system F family protein [Mangrovactinospora gilvigrisea]OIV35671.1 hypothetical protein BIV57_20285 [Mangrovactinospora gilvigrisea]